MIKVYEQNAQTIEQFRSFVRKRAMAVMSLHAFINEHKESIAPYVDNISWKEVPAEPPAFNPRETIKRLVMDKYLPKIEKRPFLTMQEGEPEEQFRMRLKKLITLCFNQRRTIQPKELEIMQWRFPVRFQDLSTYVFIVDQLPVWLQETIDWWVATI